MTLSPTVTLGIIMRANPRKIKHIETLIGVHGFTLTEVLTKELGMTLTDFAEANGVRRSEVSMTVNGHKHRVYPEIREALAKAIGVTAGEIGRLIDTYAESRSGNRVTRTKRN